MQDDDDLGEHVAAQPDHRQKPRSDRRLRLEERLGPVLNDAVGEIEQAAEGGEVDRLIDEERGEGDVAGQRGGENDAREHPNERSQRRPGIVWRRSRRADWLRPELAQRVSDHERGEGRADRPARDRDVERGDGVGRWLDQPLGGPDRRDRHRGAIEDRSRAIAHRHEAPGREAWGDHAPRKRVDSDQDPQGVERRVDEALDARIGKVEGVERARHEAEARERQRREDEEEPRGGKRAAEPARRGGAGIAMEHSAGEPAERRDGQEERKHDRRHADLLRLR